MECCKNSSEVERVVVDAPTLARLKLGAAGDSEDAFSGSSRTLTLDVVACGQTLETG